VSNIPEVFRYNRDGGPPWHGQGVALDPSIAPGAAIMADPILGSTVSLRPQQFPRRDGTMADSASYTVVRDYDDRQLSGSRGLGPSYTPAQPADKAALLDRIASEFGARFDVAGTLRGGAQWWAQASFGEPLKLAGDDKVFPRFTIFDSFDGSLPLAAGLASTRAVCSNTIAHALGEARGAAYYRPIRHTGDVAGKLASAGDAFSMAVRGWESFAEFAQIAAATAIPKSDAHDIIAALVPLPTGDASPAKANAKREAIWGAFAVGIGNSGRTAWDFYNGVTQYATWESPVRGDGNRWQSALLGDGADLAAAAETQLRVYMGM
jgi:phage/plasmid-like protein (TIGR03299 family)